MSDNIMEGLNVISDIVSNYDDTYYTKSEITDHVLESSINEIIEFTDIIMRDINRIRDIVNRLLEDNNDR